MKININTMKFTLFLFFSIFIGTGITFGQQTPGGKQNQSILIKGATAHIGDGTVILDAAIGFKAGKIDFVGKQNQVNQSDYQVVINAQGKHVYPGFIALDSTLGLVEIDAVRATRDHRDVGSFLPHIRSLIAYNAESKVIESMRPNGILMGQIVPRGGYISGRSSFVQFDAWNWEDALIKEDEGVHLNWPRLFFAGRWWIPGDPPIRINEKYQEQVEKIKDYFNQAQAYLKDTQAGTHLPFNAMKGIFDGTQNLYVHADFEKQIGDVLTFLKKKNIPKIVLVGASGAHKYAKQLAKEKIAVILAKAHRLPNHEDEDIFMPFKLAHILSQENVLVSFGVAGDMERQLTRNLPFWTGTAASYGLGKEKALSLITLNAAKILGVDKKVGSLAVGKDATLFISLGDALDMMGNQISHAFIQGREISLKTHQTKLWKRYSDKYNHK